MTDPQSPSQLPERALHEFEKISDSDSDSDWESGVPLIELLERINRVAEHLAPEDDGQNSRVKRTFTERSFRHYQNLGCIDPAEKEGRCSIYGYRHFVQALLVRKLLWERIPSDQIAVVMAGCSTEETEQMFLGGIEMVARAGENRNAQEPPASGMTETWRRVQVMPGVELHLSNGLPTLGEAERKELRARLETALRENLR